MSKKPLFAIGAAALLAVFVGMPVFEYVTAECVRLTPAPESEMIEDKLAMTVTVTLIDLDGNYVSMQSIAVIPVRQQASCFKCHFRDALDVWEYRLTADPNVM